MTRVGFLINFNADNGLGVFNFLINLFKCLSLAKNKKIKPVLILNKKSKNVKYIKFKKLGIEVVETDFFLDEYLLKRIFNKILIFFLGKSFIYEEFFKKLNIDILSHTLLPLGRNSSIKSFPWLGDFQYYYYPDNFSVKNRILKKINIMFCAKHSTKIILSSTDSRNDLKKISIGAYRKSVVNQFSFGLIKKNKILTLKQIKKKYNIKYNFFYLPNQYFVHKNHIVVLKALRDILKNKNNKKITIISTGLNNDHRNKEYYKNVKFFINHNNLGSNYLYLGIVPYNDVQSLMYHSVALINPSKFEGWSSSVEQAKSMGKKIILSNIKVHKEQKPKRAQYFNQDDFIHLSKILQGCWHSYNKIRELKIIKRSYGSIKNRLLKYALDYQKIILNS